MAIAKTAYPSRHAAGKHARPQPLASRRGARYTSRGMDDQALWLAFANAALGLGAAYVTNGLHDPLVVQLRAEEFAQAVFEACE